jgi:hypothetical protein
VTPEEDKIRVNTSPIQKDKFAVFPAIDILDGLPDEISINSIILEQDNINNLNNPQFLQKSLETVSRHASALL